MLLKCFFNVVVKVCFSFLEIVWTISVFVNDLKSDNIKCVCLTKERGHNISVLMYTFSQSIIHINLHDVLFVF